MNYLRAFFVSVLAIAVIGVLCAGVFIHLGIYSVAALQQHTGFVYGILEYARVRSITTRTQSGSPNLSELDWQQRGLSLYEGHCKQCHGAPGVAPDAFAMGMMPAPSPMVKIALEKSPSYIFWSISHGVKMSGMPAWKYRLSDGDIWSVVALVEKMPTFTAMEYSALERDAEQAPAAAIATFDSENLLTESERLRAGRVALQQYNCAGCHEVPGIVAATTHVGPTLKAIGEQVFIAGTLPMNAETLKQWIMSPQRIKPLTLMPDMGVTEQHAELMVEYLLTKDERP